MTAAHLTITGFLLASVAIGCADTASLEEDVGNAGDAIAGFHGHYPSPTIARDGSKYHAYFAKQTIDGTSYKVPHGSFTEDGAWRFHGDALPHLGHGAEEHGVVWAPAAAKISDGHWMLYYTAHKSGTAEKKCIWRAHATDANGPFVDDYAGPIECLDDSLWAIDPYLVQGDGGNWHLVARLDEPGGVNTIQIRKLDEKAEHFASGADWKLLVKNSPSSWEQPVLENAGMVQLTPDDGSGEGRWFVFYSARAWDKDSYAIGYADCGDKISGHDRGHGKPRCKKVTTDGPWLDTDASKGVFGPGTPTFYTDEDGRTLMSVQAWKHAGGDSNPKNHGQIMLTYKIHVHGDYEPHVKLLRVDE